MLKSSILKVPVTNWTIEIYWLKEEKRNTTFHNAYILLYLYFVPKDVHFWGAKKSARCNDKNIL